MPDKTEIKAFAIIIKESAQTYMDCTQKMQTALSYPKVDGISWTQNVALTESK